MRRIITLLWILVLLSCAKSNFDPSQIVNGIKSGTLSAKDAGEATYRFAFSGQVLEEKSGTPVKKFSVELAGHDTSINTIFNGLGERNGVFHISRNPTAKDHAFASVPIIISASGYEPVVQMLDLGSDCQTVVCPGSKPTAFFLERVVGNKVASETGLHTFIPARVQEWINQKGVTSLFQDAVNKGKIDPSTEAVLSKSKNGQTVNNVLIMLNGVSGNQTPHIINDLLGSVKTDKIQNLAGGVPGTVAALAPMLATSNPDIAGSLVAANALLPYLTPIADKISASKTGPLGQVLVTFLRESNYQSNMLTLVAALSGKPSSSNRPILAMSSLLPLVDGMLARSQAPLSPVGKLLSEALSDPTRLNALAGGYYGGSKDPACMMLSQYLQPLIQAFAGPSGTELISLFNGLIRQNGILALKNFSKDTTLPEIYSKLIPYLEPVVRGLNSKDAQSLAQAMMPFLKDKNPGNALVALLSSPDTSTVSPVVGALYPGMSEMLSDALPGKQLFVAQLIQGLINGEFKDLKVSQDLKSAPALVVSGQARDIFKLSQLANVTKISIFPAK